MDEQEQEFCLKWNGYHANLTKEFSELYETKAGVNITLSCEGKSLKAHKMLLFGASPFFRQLLKHNSAEHPIVIMKDFKFKDVEDILRYIYQGEISIPEDRLESFIDAATKLKIDSLTATDEDSESEESLDDGRGYYSHNRHGSPKRKRRRRRRSRIYDQRDGFNADGRNSTGIYNGPYGQPMDYQEQNWPPLESSHQIKTEILDDDDCIIEEPTNLYSSRPAGFPLNSENQYNRMPNSFNTGNQTNQGQTSFIPGMQFNQPSRPLTTRNHLDQASTSVIPGNQLRQVSTPYYPDPQFNQNSRNQFDQASTSFDSRILPNQASTSFTPAQESLDQELVPMEMPNDSNANSSMEPSFNAVNLSAQASTSQNSSSQLVPKRVPPVKGSEGEDINPTYLKFRIPNQVQFHCCSYCPYKSKNKTHLINHVKTHTGEKPFHCDQCDHSCNQKSNLTKHKKSKHP